MKDAFIAIFPPPPVQGLGTIGGFKLQVEDRTDLGYDGARFQAIKAVARQGDAKEPATRRRLFQL